MHNAEQSEVHEGNFLHMLWIHPLRISFHAHEIKHPLGTVGVVVCVRVPNEVGAMFLHCMRTAAHCSETPMPAAV